MSNPQTPPVATPALASAARPADRSRSVSAITSESAPSTSARSPSTRGPHVDRLGRARQRVPVDRLADAREQRLAHRAQVAADDDRLRVHVVAEVGEHAPDRAAGVADDAPRAEVAAATSSISPASVEVAARARRAQRREQRRDGGDRLQAAAAAAAADGAVGLHLHVAELARDAGRAAVQRARRG